VIEHLRNNRHLGLPGCAARAPPEHDNRSAGSPTTARRPATAPAIRVVALDLGFG